MNKLILFIMAVTMIALPALAQEDSRPQKDSNPTTTGYSQTQTNSDDPSNVSVNNQPETNDATGYTAGKECPEGWEMTPTGECGKPTIDRLKTFNQAQEQRENFQERQTKNRADLQEKKGEIKERRSEMKEKIEERHQEIRDRLQSRLGEVARTIVARFENMVERLRNIQDRVDSAIVTAETAGKDMTTAKAAALDAEVALTKATGVVGQMKTTVDSWLATKNDDEFKANLLSGQEDFKKQAGVAKEELKKAWNALRSAVKAIKSAPSQEPVAEVESKTEAELINVN